jgi:nucleoside-triphosphatase
MSIYIFSRPVQSGKTTELLHWCRKQHRVAGILMPDINGSRKIFDIETGNIFDIEQTEPDTDPALLTNVGRFKFYTAAFEKANAILSGAISKNYKWLVIDEAGKLELGGKGFYQAIIEAIARFDGETGDTNLLMTVREGLCDEVTRFFRIRDYQVIHSLDELEQA